MFHLLTAGGHSFSLDGISPNCSGEHLEYRPVVVAADSVTSVEFQIDCRKN